MSITVLALRGLSLLAFVGPMLIAVRGRRQKHEMLAGGDGQGRAPVVANLSACVLFFFLLLVFSSSSASVMAVPLAFFGCVVAVAGTAVVQRSRAELGPAWSFVPKADEGTGLTTTGPYRVVRHPIYLGLAMLASGEGLAFGSWPALLVVFCGIVPTFVWRARTEEKLLLQTFGDSYAAYRRRTKMIIPHFLTFAAALILLSAAPAYASTCDVLREVRLPNTSASILA